MLYVFQDDEVGLPSFASGTTEYLIDENNEEYKADLIEICFERTLEMADIQILHENIWECIHEFVINKAVVHVVYYKLENKYYRAYKPSMEGFALKSDDTYCPIGNRIWGHEKFFQISKMCERCHDRKLLTNRMNSLVYFIDMELIEEEFEREIKCPAELHWQKLINEIIADG